MQAKVPAYAEMIVGGARDEFAELIMLL